MEALSVYVQVLLHLIIFSRATNEVDGNTRELDWVGALNYTVVHFDPYVSILDKNNPYRYTFDELVLLVGQVATRFNKILIQQSETDLQKELPTSLLMSATAAAEYNRQPNRTKLEVWLSYASNNPHYSYDRDDFIYHREPRRVIKRMMSLARQANTIATGTVSTILFPYKLIMNDRKHLEESNYAILSNLSRSVHQWGIIVESETISIHPLLRRNISVLNPDIVVYALPHPPNHAHLPEYFRTHLEQLQAFAGRNVKHGIIISVPDTDTNGNVNSSRLVTTWNQAMEWAEQSGTTVILSKAIDKPSANFIEAKTNGWWRLVENSVYKNASDFRFEEKFRRVISADTNGSLESPQLRQRAWNRNHVQIIFSLGGNRQNKMFQHILPEETDVLLAKLAKTFNHIVLVTPDYAREAYRNIHVELSRIGRLDAGKLEATLVLMPHTYLAKILIESRADFVKSRVDYSQVMKPITAYVVPFMGNETEYIGNYLKNKLLTTIGIRNDTLKFGYAFDATLCSYYHDLSNRQATVMEECIKSEEAQVLIFHFEEDDQTIKLGVDRMFQQRIVVIEECKRLVSTTRKLDSVKLSFMMLHYSTSSGFYQSRRDMVNYVDYLQRLSDWAEKTNSTIILNNAVDGYRFRKQKGEYETEIGWWRYDGSDDFEVGGRKISGDHENLWMDKLEEIKFRFPDTNTTQALEQSGMLPPYLIVLLSLQCVLVIIVIIVALVHKVRTKHPEELMQDFFKGTGTDGENEDGEETVALRLPYNRDRYEINSNIFSIQKDRLLGSGEFGKVMRGSFVQNGECINAAVKTVNSLKGRSSALSGLLSEIKVLSYVGKHQNITELLAANTEDLQNGKVYMFLELCELGSLEKYLRGMPPPENDCYSDLINMTRRKSELDERVDKYLEMVSRKGSLEESSSQDMYRWSQEICRGMEYLSSKHVVHADLATRNVLLDFKKEAKICDFGLSRRMYNYTNYVKKQQEPLPWKWMSPEALRKFEFSEKSDVWAYGVTMWEIYSLAEQPYPGLAWHIDFPDTLEEGLRLLEPKYSDNNVYWIMTECWQTSPQCRPTFADLMKMFD